MNINLIIWMTTADLHDTFDEFHSGLRQLLEVVAKVRVKEEYTVMENGEKKYDLCKAFVDMKLEGIIEGRKEGKAEGKLEGKLEERQEHLIRTVCIKLRKNKPAALIADELEEELSTVERVIEAQQKAGCYDVERICAVLAE